VSSAIANFFVVYTTQSGSADLASSSDSQDQQQLAGIFHAAEVLLHFCVNTYEISTAGGVSSSRVVHSSALAGEDSAGGTFVSVRDSSDSSTSTSSPNRLVLRAAGAEEQVYSVKRDDVRLLNEYLRSSFSGTYSREYGKTIGGETSTSEALGLAMFRREPLDDEGLRTVVRNLTSNVATSLTNTQVIL